MSNKIQHLPAITNQSGSRVGNTYTSSYARCPHKHFLANWFPSGDGDETSPTELLGLRPRFTKDFLLSGRVFHEGIAEWYRSGCIDGEDTGQRSLEQAIEVARSEHTKSIKEYEEKTAATKAWEDISWMLDKYDGLMGPNSIFPEWPQVQVAHNDMGEPIIEKEFQIPLGYGNFYFTSKPDMLILQDGYLKTRDHKTSVPNKMYVDMRLKSIIWDTQFTGEYMVLTELFPDIPLMGVEMNLVLKPSRTKSKLASHAALSQVMREVTTRDQIDIECYKMELLDILHNIDDALNTYNDLTNKGWSIEAASAKSFPRHGTRNDSCAAYRGCEFLELCTKKSRWEQSLKFFGPRTVKEVTEGKERGF